MPGGPVRPTYQPTSQPCSYCPTSSTNQPQDPASVNQGQLVDLPHASQIVDSQPQASLAQPSPAPGNSNSMPGSRPPHWVPRHPSPGGEYLATRVQESLVHTSQGYFGLRMCTAVTQPVAPSCYYPTPQPRDDQYVTVQGGTMLGRHQYFTGYAVQTPEASSQPYSPEGEGSRIAQVQPQYHEPLSGEPHLLGDHSYIPVPHAYEPPTRDVPSNASHARNPAASCSPPEYARISAASHHTHEDARLSAAPHHPHEHARLSAASRHAPEFSQTPIATYGSSGDVQLPAVQYNPQDYAALPASSSHPTVRNRPRYKDLRYDGKCNLKAFLHKFVRQQWNETEQHDQFCFFLEGPAIEYYTLMLETTPCLRFSEILRKFDKRFGSSAPDLTHQLNFQSATQNSGESLRQWSD